MDNSVRPPQSRNRVKRDPSILVVDDAGSNRLMIRSILEGAGYPVAEACDGDACLAWCAERVPRAIILDVMMPKVDGLAVLRELRERHRPEELPIIMVSTLSDAGDVAHGLNEGANDYITKPVNRVVLLARLRSHLALQESMVRSRELEDQLHQALRLETVSVFAGGIAHNFNNLFGGMLGATEILERLTKGDDRATRCLVVLKKGIEGGTRLTKRMAVMGTAISLDNEKLSTHADVISVISNIIEVQRLLVGDRIEITLESEGMVPRVGMKEPHLAEMVGSLLSNSIDAISERGSIVVSVSRPKPSRVRIVIRDTGQGMSKEVLGRVFEPFFSTKNLDTVNGLSIEGNGLGMWNVHNLLQMVGGAIDVKSEVGKGTEVTLDLPVEEAGEGAST